MNKRYVLSQIMDRLYLFDLTASIRNYLPRQRLIALTHHRVYDIDQKTFVLAEEVIDNTSWQFEQQLRFISKHFSVITSEDLYQHYVHGELLPRNCLMITFDDGYKDNYYNAFRLLKKYNLRATFFVATEYIEQCKLFWWDEIFYIINSSCESEIELLYPWKHQFRLDTPSDRLKVAQKLLRIVKNTYNIDLELFLEELATSAGVTVNEKQLADPILLTWSEIDEMSQAGMEIGSHTKTHRVLSNLPEGDLREELRGSKQTLEQRLGKQVLSLSYPVGGYNARVLKEVRACGYTFAFAPGGRANTGITDPYGIKRIGVGKPFSYFKGSLTMPSLICY